MGLDGMRRPEVGIGSVVQSDGEEEAATDTGPGSCAGAREGVGEALPGAVQAASQTTLK